MQTTAKTELFTRLGMVLIGAIAGLSHWALAELLPDMVDNHRFYLLLASACFGFFVLLLVLLGELKPSEAFGVSGVLAMTAAALVYWHSGRFTDVDQQFDVPFAFVAWAVLLKLGAPFGAAVVKGRVRDYTYLFDTAWGIVVRYLAAWVFVGLFWALLMLSNELLGIVGITIIEDLLDYDVVPFVLTGAVLGLALAVAQDLKAYISPYLVLRLLRLLLPMLLVVVLVFIVALPVQGLSTLFGSFSAAGIVMGIAIAAITLITSALDRDNTDAISSRFMIFTTKAMALVLPVLAGLALWAIWLRVSEYGWTPERLAASIAAAFVLAYALLYAGAILRASAWADHIRQANIILALGVMGVAVLWLTPILNAEKISAQNQVNRYLRGLVQAKDFPAWELQNAWGLAGQQAATKLSDLPEDTHSQIIADLDRAAAQNKWEFNRETDTSDDLDHAQSLFESLQIHPAEATITAEALVGLATYTESWANICQEPATSNCQLMIGPFANFGEDAGIFIIPGDQSRTGVFLSELNDDGFTYARRLPLGDAVQIDDLIENITSGNWRIAPSSRQSLWVGETELSADN